MVYYLTVDNHDARTMKKFLFFLLVFITGACLMMPAHALTVSPVVLDIVVDPGSFAEEKIILKNEEQRQIHAVPTIFQVMSADQHGFPRYAPITNDSFLARAISFPQGSEYVLKPGEEREVPLRVTVSSDAEPGGRYAVISWGAQEFTNGIALSGQPGVNVAIDVAGEVDEQLNVQRFSLAGTASWMLDRPVLFEADLKNTGGRHSAVTGVVMIRNIFGAVVATLPLMARLDGDYREPIRILPDTLRTLYAVWGEGFALGPYTATLHINTSAAGVHTATASFIIISPLVIGVAFGFIILFLIFLLLKTLRR